MNEQILNELKHVVRREFCGTKFKNILNEIIVKATNEVGIEQETVIRRDFDGCSSGNWLIEKMLGELLIERKIK